MLQGAIRSLIKIYLKYLNIDDKTQDKKILGAFNGSFETKTESFENKKIRGQQTVKGMTEFINNTRYSWVDNEKL